jgi:hypothetical protein
MEQFLNFFWLAITLVTTVTWRMGWLREQRGSHHPSLQEAVRLGCAFLLLFFTISMTDDLHAEMVLIEGGDQRHSVVLHCADQPSHAGTVAWGTCVAILPTRVVLEPKLTSSELSPVVEECRSTLEEPLPPDRSPPASSL